MLEACSRLSSSTQWSGVTATQQAAAGFWIVREPVADARRFYRLRRAHELNERIAASQELKTKGSDMLRVAPFQFLKSLLHFR
jgi:hypothetical protein